MHSLKSLLVATALLPAFQAVAHDGKGPTAAASPMPETIMSSWSSAAPTLRCSSVMATRSQ